MDSPKGEARKAKSLCRHGEFKAWVEANTKVCWRTAQRYMRVASLAPKCDSLDAFEGGLVAFLDAHAERRSEKPSTQPKPPVFTKDDAEYALKINARAERGEGGEKEVASEILCQLLRVGLSLHPQVSQGHHQSPYAEPQPFAGNALCFIGQLRQGVGDNLRLPKLHIE